MSSALKQSSTAPATGVTFLKRSDFPQGFVFGTSASSFQYEGEHESRGTSIWDTFLRENYPDLVENERALEAVHHIRRSEEDVRILKHMGVDAFRFSICWPRVLPNGRWTRGPNGEEIGVDQDGINYYNGLIDRLIENGIEPVICLFHWDLPQALETEYRGFLDIKIVDDFRNYADLCFRKFGDRVKKWITLNETWTFSLSGYLTGVTAPGRGITSEAERSAVLDILPSTRYVSKASRAKVPKEGDPYREIYIVAHHQLLAHAAAYKLYKEKYKKSQKGEVGIIVVSMWALPYTNTQEDKDAATRAIDFMLGWLMNPLVFGDYPEIMRTLVGDRLPRFIGIQSTDVKESFDFIGLNYYTSNFAANLPPSRIIYNLDSQVECHVTDSDGNPIGEQGGSPWLYVYPEGLKEVLLYIAKNYKNPPIYITENGIDELNDENLSYWEAFYDYQRISYHYRHLLAIKEAIEDGEVNVKGYFAWSLLDNLEGAQGFHTRFGINYVDLKNNYERYPKLSAGWFKFLLEN